MLPNYAFIFFAAISLWILILTIYLWRLSSHYNKLTKGVNNKSLRSIMEETLDKIDVHGKEIDYLKNYCASLEKEGFLHIQKIGLLRFNPFKDTGGNQSFILSLVDAKDTGIVISALYSRSGTRWYAKRVVSGKGVEYELSEEEKKALKTARKEE